MNYMKLKRKFVITKHLKILWETESQWENIPTKYTYHNYELKVDFDFGNYIIFKERDLTITAIAYPRKAKEEFSIGDVKFLDKIELFVLDNLIQ